MIEKFHSPKVANVRDFYVAWWPCLGEGLRGGQCGVGGVISGCGSRE